MSGVDTAALRRLLEEWREADGDRKYRAGRKLDAALRKAAPALLDAAEEAGRLSLAWFRLATACRDYRAAHDGHGDGSPEAGRAWDAMRRAENDMLTALEGKVIADG